MTRKALGRGLKALLPDEKPPAGTPLQEVPVDKIVPGKYQPREQFQDEELAELAASLKAKGLIQPVIVRPSDRGSYELIAGERRWRAARQAGLAAIPALIRNATEGESLELALIENLQRADLNPIETARAYRRLIDEFDLTQEEVAARVGKERPSVSNHLRLLSLPKEIQQDVVSRRLTMGHARALLALSGPEGQLRARGTVLKRGLSVRETERLVQKLSSPATAAKRSKVRGDVHMKELENRVRRALGTRVRIRARGKGGTMEIQYFSEAELDRLVNHLVGRNQP